MGVFRFPFNWGVETPAATVVPTVTIPSSGTRWTAHACDARTWAEGVSTPRRFERLYTQPVSTFGQSVNFSFQIQNQFPFRVQTNNGPVQIQSTITNP